MSPVQSYSLHHPAASRLTMIGFKFPKPTKLKVSDFFKHSALLSSLENASNAYNLNPIGLSHYRSCWKVLNLLAPSGNLP